MRVERLQPSHRIKAVLEHFLAEMQRAGYSAAWARKAAGPVRAGQRPALVALADGRPVGLLSWKGDGGRVTLSLLTVAQGDPEPAAAALLQAALPALQADGATHVLHLLRQTDQEPYRQAFLNTGFEELRVEKLTRQHGAPVPMPRAPAGYALRPWQPEDSEATARLFLRLQREPLQSVVWPELCTLEGVRALFDVLMQVEGRAAWVLTGDGSAGLIGYVLARCDRAGDGHIGEVGVAPEHQGHGLGRLLVSAALASLADAPEVWLTVASSNAPALHLYRSLGFETTQTQSAFVWQASSTPEGAHSVAENAPMTQE